MREMSDDVALQIVERELDIERMASNLAEWFGTGRSLPAGHTGAMVLEPKYVETLLAGINQKYLEIVALTNDWELPNE
jgi:hypothetical protein